MSFQERARSGICKSFLRLSLGALGVFPKKAARALMRVPQVRKTYRWLLHLFPQEMLVDVQGNKMYIHPADSTLDREFLLLGRTYEEGTTRVFRDTIKRGMTVVDIGAHIGYFTLVAAELVGREGKVFAFEPEPRNFSLLKRNVDLNGYKNTVLVNSAVSNEAGIVNLYLDSTDSGCNSLFSNERSQGSTPVAVTTLDDFVPDDVTIDFVKIDIEGTEEKALQGMERTLSKGDAKVLILEFNHQRLQRCGSSARRLWDKLDFFGFEMLEIGDNGIRKIAFDAAVRLGNAIDLNLVCLRK